MEEVFLCSHCKQSFTKKNLTLINDCFYCQKCRNELFYFCENCAEYRKKYVFTRISDGSLVCNSCLRNDFFYCEACQKWYPLEDEHFVNGSCYCEDCFGEYFTICDECGETINRDDANIADDGTYCCNYCYEQYHNKKLIYNFDYKRNAKFFGVDGYDHKAKVFGIELETDGYNTNLDVVAKELLELSGDDFFFLKEDGSLDNGIEIVTEPATLNYFLKYFPIENIQEIVVDNGGSSHDNGACGLHVHFNRKYFKNSDLASMKMLFVFEKCWNEIVKFSRRENFQYCHKNIDIESNTVPFLKKEVANCKNKQLSSGRYQAINLLPVETIEIRIFRGTLNPLTFKATMQFCEMLADIAENFTVLKIQVFKWSIFEKIAIKKGYDEFLQYCKIRGV